MNMSKKMAKKIFITSESGVTAVEYGLIAALIAIGIIVGITSVGTNLNGLFNYVGTKVTAP